MAERPGITKPDGPGVVPVQEKEKPMRYLVKHATTGDVFVIEQDASGHTIADSHPLHVSDWSRDDGYNPDAGMDLYAIETHALDTPNPDDSAYRFLLAQDGYQNPARDIR